MRNTKNTKGFTLVEMMVVVGLILLLLVFIIRNATQQKIVARDNVRVSDIQVMRLAIEEYKSACGEYPSTIEPNTANGCGSGQKLSDFLPNIPVNPNHANGSLIIANGFDSDSQIAGSNGYFYAGKSSFLNGPCYDYHIAAELELAVGNDEDRSPYLDKDHDASKNAGTYRYNCLRAANDFGSNSTTEDDKMGLYDFRANSAF